MDFENLLKKNNSAHLISWIISKTQVKILHASFN
jgi:hypothetical protein